MIKVCKKLLLLSMALLSLYSITTLADDKVCFLTPYYLNQTPLYIKSFSSTISGLTTGAQINPLTCIHFHHDDTGLIQSGEIVFSNYIVLTTDKTDTDPKDVSKEDKEIVIAINVDVLCDLMDVCAEQGSQILYVVPTNSDKSGTCGTVDSCFHNDYCECYVAPSNDTTLNKLNAQLHAREPGFFTRGANTVDTISNFDTSTVQNPLPMYFFDDAPTINNTITPIG